MADMTRDRTIERLNRCREILEITSHMDNQNRKAFDMAIKALEQEPCEDAISRQAAINSIWDGTNMDIYTSEVKESLEALPSVTPQPKTGHWIMTSDYLTTAYGSVDYVKCSCCGEDSLEAGDFCPNCGAYLRGDDNADSN